MFRKKDIKSVSSTGQGDPDQGVQCSGGEFSQLSLLIIHRKSEYHKDKGRQEKSTDT